MQRNILNRQLVTASKHQHKKAGPDGLGCPICNPNSGRAAKQNARNKADLRHMEGLE